MSLRWQRIFCVFSRHSWISFVPWERICAYCLKHQHLAKAEDGSGAHWIDG